MLKIMVREMWVWSQWSCPLDGGSLVLRMAQRYHGATVHRISNRSVSSVSQTLDSTLWPVEDFVLFGGSLLNMG